MNTRLNRSSRIAAAALLLSSLLGTQALHAATMSRPDYVAGKQNISTTYKSEMAACKAMSGNARDICHEEVKAKEKVALAELEFGYTGTRKDQDRIVSVKADTAYAVAKERCDDQAGNAKSVCVQQAKAARTKALADLKMGQKTGAARADAMEDKRDADYKVAAQKCETLAGDAKTGCMATAKMQAGKS